MPEIESRLADTLRTLAPADAPLVVGVSGGADSTALLRLLPPSRSRLIVAHLHHGVRGPEADADAAFVAGLAASLGRPFETDRWEPVRPGHFEADARQARYAFLADVAHRHEARHVAVAHTLDDQAETVLHRILRGTGPRGLAGMPVSRRLAEGLTLIRPLLAARVGRRDVIAYLDRIGQSYRTDATNADAQASTRAWIRHVVLPSTGFPHAAESLVRLADLVRLQNEALAPVLDAAEASVVGDDGRLDRRALVGLPPSIAVELVRRIWCRQGWPERSMTADRWHRLAELVRDGRAGSHPVASGIVLTQTATHSRLDRPARVPVPDPPQMLPIPGQANWSSTRIVASLSPPGAERIDLDRIEPPLSVRGPEPGDRFAPLGLDGHSQPLADFLRGRHVAASDRPRVPLVCDQTGIVWVVGHRIADRVQMTAQTTQVLHLRAEAVPCD
jgi:tRNA(Ile)-lysidine synthase